jgi:hypothetical protein
MAHSRDRARYGDASAGDILVLTLASCYYVGRMQAATEPLISIDVRSDLDDALAIARLAVNGSQRVFLCPREKTKAPQVSIQRHG